MPAERSREQVARTRRRRIAGLAATAVVATVGTALGVTRAGVVHAQPPTTSSCVLSTPSGHVSHVINLVFDNVHFTRDNPSVPSDLEQMPHLLNFIENNGVLLSDMHTPLIAHTADDIVTTLTGVYGDKHGQPVSNSYRVYNDGTNGTTAGGSVGANSFVYWTDPVSAFGTTSDTAPSMVTPAGKNAPAPWVPYTRAGCDVGAYSTANLEVESANPDLKAIYGANSTQWQSVLADQTAHGNTNLSNANYQGIAVHCAKTSESVCHDNSNAAADSLPDEPGGYSGYQALYGNVNVGPAVGGTSTSNGVCVNDLDGNPLLNTDVGPSYCGFGGFDPTPAQTLGYVAAMQEHGIPVTYGYIEDAHADNVGGTGAYGPGQAAYTQQLKAFDEGFVDFFDRLQSDGITPQNTLFEISSDEGDHFTGTQHPTPAGCDGSVSTPCTYAKGTLGEVSLNVNGLLTEQYKTAAVSGSTYQVHSDSAVNFYVNGNPQPSGGEARTLEQQMGGLLAADTYANNDTGGVVPVTNFLADQVEESVLHFDTGDPNRMPTFTDFANPDFFIFKGGTTCSAPKPTQSDTVPPDPQHCVLVDPAFAWNHGDVGNDINNNWAAFVGPGVTARGVDATTWADETDIRPTILSLVGLHDDYTSDGRVLVEDVAHSFLPNSSKDQKRYQDLVALETAYKQLNADVGTFGHATLRASTTALEDASSGQSTYTTIENELATLDGQRDSLAAQIETLLDGVEFNGQNLNLNQAETLTQQANDLISQAQSL